MQRPKLTYANVVSTLALTIAVGGGSAYAAATIATSDIQSGAITNSKLANSAVTGAKVKNGSLTSSDFKSGSLPKGATGATGPAGPAGPAGATGPAGAAATANGVFASINADGSVVAGSSGITTGNIAHVSGSALYCVSGLTTPIRTVQVTGQNGFFGGTVGTATAGAFSGCATGTQVSIVLRSLDGNGRDNAFFLTIQ